MVVAKPHELIQQDKQAARDMAERIGRRRSVQLLERAQKELVQRIRSRVPSSPREFTNTQLELTLAQVRAALADLQVGMRDEIVTTGKRAAAKAAGNLVEYAQAAEKHFKGVHQALPIKEAVVLDRAAKGTESSILHRLLKGTEANKKVGILQRYGDLTVEKFEETLQKRFLAKTPWSDVRNELIADSPWLQSTPLYWTERIVRTEVMGAHNRATWEAMRAVDEQVGGGMVKVLVATFDGRTGSDSYAVHGQIRLPNEPFQWWGGNYQAPPNRPNDREIMVMHSVEWPIPGEMEQRSDGEVAARWREEGRKGSPPPRPKMTTVPLSYFPKS